MDGISFAFSTHTDAWYRCEAVGRTDAGEGAAGWALLCPELPAELRPFAGALEGRTFAADEWWDPEQHTVVAQPVRGGVSLAGKTLHVVSRGMWDIATWGLRGLCKPARPASVTSPPAPTQGAKLVSVDEVARLLATKRCLVFTGAGISRAAGVPDFATFDFGAAFGIGGPLRNAFVEALVERPDDLIERCRSAFVVEPTAAHRALRRIHDRYPFRLASGNIDGLHEETGLRPEDQRSDTEVQFSGLADADALIAVGISHDGMGPVAAEYRRARPDGVLVALDLEPPSYLQPGDWLLRGDLQASLPEVAARVAELSVAGRPARAGRGRHRRPAV